MLLVYSIVFFVVSSPLYTGLYLLISIIITWYSAKLMLGADKEEKLTKKKWAYLFGILTNLLILFVLKYSNFGINNINVLCKVMNLNVCLRHLNIAAPIGVSFYTLQIVGYLTDIYWRVEKEDVSLLETALFAGYYPQMTSGPISRFGQIKEGLFSEHRFDWNTVTFGLQRVLWGLFKKLVISERLSIVVNTIYSDIDMYRGFYIWMAAVLFTLQLYTDFSGCIDIIMGASECYGVKLPENFRTPLFSRSVQEFWQRWHITLGLWLKDYILYPVLRSKFFNLINKKVKSIIGKKTARSLTSHFGALCVWLLIGLWHGGDWKYILGMGLWFWGCIAGAEIFKPVFNKIIGLLHINTETFSWHLFQSVRVLFLVSIGNMFFRLDSLGEVKRALGSAFSTWNPEILYDGSIYELGLNEKNILLVMIALLVLLLISVLQEKCNVREKLASQNIVFRWIIYFVLIFSIIIYGQYGPGFDAQSFIYQGF